ncbi:hypothetical protein FACS189450_12880 [Spirochaetia bacterium]|nr:hypothetical protein FACS189450_12880 [Spirochaetia bacterium]
MKKILVVFLALAVAGGLFAQIPDGFKIDGQVRTGVSVKSDEDDSTVTVGNWDDPDGLSRVRFNFSFAQENFGWNVRLQSDANIGGDFFPSGDTSPTGDDDLPIKNKYIGLPLYGVWFSAFDGKFRLDAGHGDVQRPLRSQGQLGSFGGNVFQYGSNWGGPDGNGLFLLQFKLIDGLNIVGAVGHYAQFNATAKEWFGNENWGFVYSTGAITASASWAGVWNGTSEEVDNSALVWLKYAGDGWAAAVDANIAFGDDTTANIGLVGNTNLNALYLKLAAQIDVTTVSGKDAFGFAVKPAVSYQLSDPMKLGVDLNLSYAETPGLGVNIAPSFHLNIGSGADIVIYDIVGIETEPEVKLNNRVGVALKWGF